jgi:hypothetical protein
LQVPVDAYAHAGKELSNALACHFLLTFFVWFADCHLQSSSVQASTQGVLAKLEHMNSTIMAFTSSMQATYDSLTSASNDLVSVL